MDLETYIATLIPGQLCNVSEPRHPALMRVVTKVERVKRNGQEWVRWHWVPGDAIPADHVARRGMVDCGYSGAVVA